MKKTDNGITELVFILDRSGSMSGLESDTIGGFNAMIEKQKKLEGKAFVTTVLFDTEFNRVHDRTPLPEVKKMTAEDYFVGGCTALYDAVGSTVTHIENVHRYARPEDVPERTVFVITTDGMENASKEYGAEDVKRLISRKKECGWEFLFLAANIDAVGAANAIGIDSKRAVKYKADKKGTKLIYEEVGAALCNMRAGKAIEKDWSEAIRRDFQDREG